MDAIDLHERALVLRAAGAFAAAEAACRRALALLRREVGADHPDVANVLVDLAAILHLRGRYRAALTTAEKALGCRDARVRVNALGQLGATHGARGEHGEALRLHRRALATAERLGPDYLAVALNNAGMACKYLGRFDEGVRFYRRALRLVDDADAVASLCHNVGGIEHARGRFAIAERWARRSVTLRVDAVARSSDEAALAAILDDRGRHEEAAILYAAAIPRLKRAYGADHPEIAFQLGNLAANDHARGRLGIAARRYEQALALKKRTLGATHPDVAITLANLALLHERRGAPARALVLLERARRIFERRLGVRHPHTVACVRDARRIRG